MPIALDTCRRFLRSRGVTQTAWVMAFLLSSHASALAAEAMSDSTGAVQPDSTNSSATLADSTAAPRPDSTASPKSRSLYGRAERGAKNFLLDTWWIFSSPGRLNRNSALATAAVLGAEAITYAHDQELYDATQRNKDVQPFKSLMNFADSYIPYGFMPNAFKVEVPVALLGYAIKNEPLRQIPVECIESHLIAGGLRNILKPIVGRAHPYEDLGPRHFEFNQGTSFPSGHTSVLFETATIVSEHVHSTPVTVILYAAATLGAVQRVESQNHWPSDVLFPAITGTVISHTIVRRNAERRAKDGTQAAERTGWTPMLDLGREGWRFGVQRGL
jgi:hypothetical protein